jgi:hypothetical protein
MKLHKDWIIVAFGAAACIVAIESNAMDVWYNGSTMDFNTYTRESQQDFQIQQLQQQQQYESYRDTTDSYGSWRQPSYDSTYTPSWGYGNDRP